MIILHVSAIEKGQIQQMNVPPHNGKTTIIGFQTYNRPRDFGLFMENNFGSRYVYKLMWNHLVLKYGKGRIGVHSGDDRVARQIEGAQGWNEYYLGTAAEEFRKRLTEAEILNVHKDQMTVEIFDYHAQYQWMKKNNYNEKNIDLFMQNQEMYMIEAHRKKHGKYPPLNKQIRTQKQVGAHVALSAIGIEIL